MPQAHKTSFLIILSLLFLLPIFFIPGGALYLDSAKSALLALGVIAAVLIFLLEIWQAGKLNIPWLLFMPVVVLLPLIYFLSALLSTPSSLSLFGYNFETGTFGFMLFGSALLILVAIIFSSTSRALQALAAFFFSALILVVFVTIKILSGGELLVWGNFLGSMGNPIGNWTDLAVSFGLLSVFISLVIGMIPMKLPTRVLLYTVFVFSTILLAVINFSVAFILTLGASILLIFYFLAIEKRFSSGPTFLPIALCLISIIFLINPTISETRGTLGDVVTNTFKVANTDVRPSLSATLSISKAVLSQEIFLGSGPNTFGHDWLIYKPVNVNTTPFWAVAFPFGIGFIPTQVASTGILGSALWLAFFTFFILLGIRVLSHIPEPRAGRFALVSTFLISLFLWVSSFLYTPSATVLMLAFFFSGLFVAISAETGIIPVRVIVLRGSPPARFVSILFLMTMVVGAVGLGWIGFEKTASAFYWKYAIDLSNITGTPLQEIESQLDKAVKFAPADVYYVALSRVNFGKAQEAANNTTTGTPEENQIIFEDALRKSIEAAKSAVSLNPAGYQNWVALGMIYDTLVPAPLSVEGAYESARMAYSEAQKRNPANPELSLLLAQLELNKGDVEAARSSIRDAIALKEDYADAYLMLAQLEVREKNTAGAIASAEKLALLMSNNSGIYFELGLLKYSDKDYIGAANAFTLALASTPDYANAKYYLGLSFAKLGRLEEAKEQFEALSVTNPDSQEVRAALEALRAGKSPL